MPQPTGTIQNIDPETARAWIGLNSTNRNIREDRITKYADDMRAGHWKLTGEAIKFAIDGRLLDGQHRLHAVLRADTTIPMFVIYGLEDHTQQYMDTGAARTSGDALALDGTPNAANVAAAARLALTIESEEAGKSRHANTISNAKVFAWIEANPGIHNACAGWRRRRDPLQRSVLTYCYYRLSNIDPEDAEHFFYGLTTNLNLQEHSPILALTEALGRFSRNRTSINRRDSVILVFRAWNAYRGDRTIRYLRMPRSGDSIPSLQ